MVVVQIEKPGNMTLANWFCELRSWLDQNYCQPTLFNQSERVTGKMIFNIMFSDETQARVFSSTFTKICTSIFTHPKDLTDKSLEDT
jgi:hypothetical protein